MSFFEVTVTKSSEIDQLKHAIDNGEIIVCSDYLSNVFFASENDVPDIIEVWQDSYPEIKSAIKTLKFHNKAHGTSKFRSSSKNIGKSWPSWKDFFWCRYSGNIRGSICKRNLNLCNEEDNNKNLIQRGENGDALASMIISKKCPELRIKWI